MNSSRRPNLRRPTHLRLLLPFFLADIVTATVSCTPDDGEGPATPQNDTTDGSVATASQLVESPPGQKGQKCRPWYDCERFGWDGGICKPPGSAKCPGD